MAVTVWDKFVNTARAQGPSHLFLLSSTKGFTCSPSAMVTGHMFFGLHAHSLTLSLDTEFSLRGSSLQRVVRSWSHTVESPESPAGALISFCWASTTRAGFQVDTPASLSL